MLIFSLFSGAALALTVTGLVESVYQPLLLLIALFAAVVVVIEKPLPKRVIQVLVAAAGLSMGLDSGAEPGPAWAVIKSLVSTWISLSFLLFDVAFYTSLCTRRPWTKVGIRVAGSWIIAISLMVLAFVVRKRVFPTI